MTKELKRISVALYYRKQQNTKKSKLNCPSINPVETKSLCNFLWKSQWQQLLKWMTLCPYRQLSGWRWERRLSGVHAGEGFLSGRGVIRAAEAQGGSRKSHVPKALVLLYQIIQHPETNSKSGLDDWRNWPNIWSIIKKMWPWLWKPS